MHLPMEERSTYHKAFLQVTNLARHSEKVRQFVLGARLGGIAADLLGVERVRLYADQALYKEPGGGITPWHADQYYWPLSSDRAVTVWIPLQDTPLEMGPLEFARGSHAIDVGRELAISDHSEETVNSALERAGLDVDREPYALGDVSYHLGWTFHRASPNRSDAARRVMTIIYVDADIRATEPRTPAHKESLEITMPGVKPGEILDTPVNPIIPSPKETARSRT
jgi:ectoine hydroxylase-related dioxygenase (phytanoyl-CoA dioxygenase family)